MAAISAQPDYIEPGPDGEFGTPDDFILPPIDPAIYFTSLKNMDASDGAFPNDSFLSQAGTIRII